ncbi:MAG: hypothetical protein WBJ13_11550 [Sedimentibacter sp.]
MEKIIYFIVLVLLTGCSEIAEISQELYNLGGLEEIQRDTLEKSKLLLNLGINLNLSPVADVSINESDFINPRTFGINDSVLRILKWKYYMGLM